MTTTTETKTFSVGAILSVTDGHMVAPITEIHDLLDWVTDDTLFTHQLPRASNECEGFLRETFPDLAEVVLPAGLDTPAKSQAFIDATGIDQTPREVPRMPAVDHTRIGPLTELAMNHPLLKVIPVQIPTEGDQ